jgi:hypothetical protein
VTKVISINAMRNVTIIYRTYSFILKAGITSFRSLPLFPYHQVINIFIFFQNKDTFIKNVANRCQFDTNKEVFSSPPTLKCTICGACGGLMG